MSNVEDDVIASEITMDEIVDCLGKEEAEEFGEIMKYAQRIIEYPTAFNGMDALIAANRISFLRTKIGARAEFYKTTQQTQTNKTRKNILINMWKSLEENINTLKLLGRTDVGMK